MRDNPHDDDKFPVPCEDAVWAYCGNSLFPTLGVCSVPPYQSSRHYSKEGGVYCVDAFVNLQSALAETKGVMPEGNAALLAQVHADASRMSNALLESNAEFEAWRNGAKGAPSGAESSTGRDTMLEVKEESDSSEYQPPDDEWGTWGGGGGKYKGKEQGKGKKGKGKGKGKDKGKDKNKGKSHGGNLKNMVKIVQQIYHEGTTNDQKMAALTLMANDIWEKRSPDFQRVWDLLPPIQPVDA